jgi:hypothetical protein
LYNKEISHHYPVSGVQFIKSEAGMFLLVGLCVGVLAFALLVGAVWTFFSQRRKMESRVLAVGTVVELATQVTANARATIICPIVEFTAPSGEKIRFTSDFGTLPASHKIGQSVNVRYDPLNPQQAEIDSAMNIWLTPLILIFMGIVACCLAVTFLGVYALAGTSVSP